MSEIEKEILGTLVELANAVKQVHTANPKPDLRPILARLDELGEKLPPDADSALLHYMQRKSYEKARSWLEERSAAVSNEIQVSAIADGTRRDGQ